jgi:hypothetical protein
VGFVNRRENTYFPIISITGNWKGLFREQYQKLSERLSGWSAKKKNNHNIVGS